MFRRVLNGIDQVTSGLIFLPDVRYGLLTAGHARTIEGQSSRKLICERLDVLHLFSPEHGLEGVAAAGKEVSSTVDSMTGLPVHSLYQHSKGGDLIEASVLEEIDAFIYDLPDIGARFYTYISSCLQIIDLCAEKNKKLYILDRPNPLGLQSIEGITLEEEDYSFVGPYSLPNRYGLTIGELARLYIHEKQLSVDLEVIPCIGLERDMIFPEMKQIFSIPSPNIPNWETAILYPGTCLIEGTNLSEGRGTSRPFTWFGAPYIDQEELCDALSKLNPEGIELRPQGFIPTYSKHEGEHCKGVSIEIMHPKYVRPVRFMVEAIDVIRNLYPEDFEFLNAGKSTVAFIDRLMGKEFTQNQDWDPHYFRNNEKKSIEEFKARTKNILIY